VRNESFFALYKGLGAVVVGIVPKMAIRFSSFEYYKSLMADSNGKVSTSSTFLGKFFGLCIGTLHDHPISHIKYSCFFLAGLTAGITEAVLVVTPMDVIKIRLQAQKHSMTDPMDIPKYRNALHCAYEIIKAEGFGALYKGVALTALRQCKLCFLVHIFPSKMMLTHFH
jgi:solute carrier family 25 citrate transporter 1